MKKTNASILITLLVTILPTLGHGQTTKSVTLKNVQNEYHMTCMSEGNVTEALKNSTIEWCKTDTIEERTVVVCLLKIHEGWFSEILL